MMMLELTAALLLSAAPTTVVSISDLDQTLPKIKTSMNWAARAKPSVAPRRFNKFSELMNLDFYDVSQWSKLGINKVKKAYVWSLPESTSTVVELSLSKPKLFDKAVNQALANHTQTRKIIDKPGLWHSPKPGQIIAVIRVGSRALFQMDRQAGSFSGKGPVEILNSLLNGASPPPAPKLEPMLLRDERLSPLRRVINHRKPKLTAAQRRKKHSVWLHHLDRSKTYLSGPITFDKDGLEVSISILDPQLVKEDSRLRSIKPKFRSRRLFHTEAIGKVGGELQVHLMPDAMRDWARDNGIKEDVSKTWSGEFHFVLMQSGALMVGVPVRKEATKAMKTKLEKSLAAYDSRLKQLRVESYRGQDVWLMWWGDVSEASMRKLLIKDKPTYGDGLVLNVDPPGLLSGLKKRSLARDKMRIPGAQMLILELAFGELMKASENVQSKIMVSPSQTRISMKLAY